MKKIFFILLFAVCLVIAHGMAKSAVAQEFIPFIPQWQISGYVFADRNGDRIQSENEASFIGTPAITIEGISPTNNAINVSQSNNATGNLIFNSNGPGTFRARRLLPGEYNVSFAPPPGITVRPTTYRVTVGDGGPPFSTFQCTNAAVNPGVSGVSYCHTIGSVNGNVQNLSFAITTAESWIRSYGLDMRFDNGITNPVPNTACDLGFASVPSASIPGFSSTITPGIFIGGTGKPLNFTPGLASTYDWKVSNTYTPPKAGALATSYTTINANVKKAGINPAELIGQQGCLSADACAPQNLISGVYRVIGDLTLTNWDVPNERYYVLLVDGNVTLGGNIQVGNTDASLLVVTSKNITVSENVGASAPYSCPAYNTTTIDGFFSTDQNFTVESTGNCASERMLTMGGGIVTNAAYRGGEFVNERDLCGGNTQYPSFSLRARPDMLLALPEVAKTANQSYQEVAP